MQYVGPQCFRYNRTPMTRVCSARRASGDTDGDGRQHRNYGHKHHRCAHAVHRQKHVSPVFCWSHRSVWLLLAPRWAFLWLPRHLLQISRFPYLLSLTRSFALLMWQLSHKWNILSTVGFCWTLIHAW